ncbi:hypothetical protein [Hyalangium versicolor]|uniref:hypothetical protein n=1 Tax=Hyalangium versicolor TaxID=2861190 RepID=UPI001CD00C6A|nr:hypothetical protein [Hyalangium versicolor]
MGTLLLILLIGVRIAALFTNKYKLEESATAWADFAHRHNLNAQGHFIQGTYSGYSLAVDLHGRRVGKSVVPTAALHMLLPAIPPAVKLKRGGFLDGSVRQQSTTPKMEALLKQPRVQQCFERVSNAYRDFYIEDSFIHAEQFGSLHTTEEMEAFIAPALELARALDEAARSMWS